MMDCRSQFLLTTSLISTRQRRLRSGETPPSPASPGSGKGKQYFTALAATRKKTYLKRWLNKQHFDVRTRSVETSALSVPIRYCSGSSLRGCPAARRLLTLPGEEGVGRSVGYAPTCVCSVSQCRRWQLDGAQTHRPAALYAQKDDLGERLPEQRRQQHPLFGCPTVCSSYMYQSHEH